MSNNPIDNFKNYFFSINPYELSLLANIIGISLSLCLNSNQQNTLGNFIELIGQQILAIQAQNQNLSSDLNTSVNLNDVLKQMDFKFEYIEELISYLKNLIDNKK